MTVRAGRTGLAVCLYVAFTAMAPGRGFGAEPLWPRLMAQNTLPKASYRESSASPTVTGPDGTTATVRHRAPHGGAYYHYLPKGEYGKTMALIRRFGGVQLFQAKKGACGAGFYVADNLASSAEYGARYLVVFPRPDARVVDVTAGDGALALELAMRNLKESHPRLAKKARWNALAEAVAADALYYDRPKGWMNWFNREAFEAVVGSEDLLAWARAVLADGASSPLRRAVALVEILRRPDELLAPEEEAVALAPEARGGGAGFVARQLEGIFDGAGEQAVDPAVAKRFRAFFSEREAWLREALFEIADPSDRVSLLGACRHLGLAGLDEPALRLVEDETAPLEDDELARLLGLMAGTESSLDEGLGLRLCRALSRRPLRESFGRPLVKTLARMASGASCLEPLYGLALGDGLAPMDRLDLVALTADVDPAACGKALLALLPATRGDPVAFDGCVRRLLALEDEELALALAERAGLSKGPEALVLDEASLLVRCLHDGGADRRAVARGVELVWARVTRALDLGEDPNLVALLRRLAPCGDAGLAARLAERLDDPALASAEVGMAALELFLRGGEPLADELARRAEGALAAWPRLPFWLTVSALGHDEGPRRFLDEARRLGPDHDPAALRELEVLLLPSPALAALVTGVDGSLAPCWWLHEFLGYAIVDRRRGEAEGVALALLFIANPSVDEDARLAVPHRLGQADLTAYYEGGADPGDPASAEGAAAHLSEELEGFAAAWARLRD